MHQPTDPGPAHQSETATEPQICCDCGQLTRQPVLVGEVHTASGAGASVYACPDDAPKFPAWTERAS